MLFLQLFFIMEQTLVSMFKSLFIKYLMQRYMRFTQIAQRTRCDSCHESDVSKPLCASQVFATDRLHVKLMVEPRPWDFYLGWLLASQDSSTQQFSLLISVKEEEMRGAKGSEFRQTGEKERLQNKVQRWVAPK